jgi:LysR family transcriptional activator of nhaA
LKWLNYHHLLYFRTIATEGSLAKASKVLRVGQPALSAQLKQLEENLGEKLFERRNRRLILTEPGALALRYANQIHGLGEELLESIQNKMFSEKASIQIGALDSVPKPILLKLVQSARLHGADKTSVFEGSGDDLFRLLDSHHLDVVLTNFRRSIETSKSKFKAKSLGKFPVAVYGTAAFLNLQKNFPQSLQRQPFILSTHHSQLRHDFDHFLQANQIQCQVVAESQDTSLKVLLSSQGVGLCVLPEVVAKVQPTSGAALHRIGRLKNVFDEYWIIEGQRLIENPVAKKLMERFRI